MLPVKFEFNFVLFLNAGGKRAPKGKETYEWFAFCLRSIVAQ